MFKTGIYIWPFILSHANTAALNSYLDHCSCYTCGKYMFMWLPFPLDYSLSVAGTVFVVFISSVLSRVSDTG